MHYKKTNLTQIERNQIIHSQGYVKKMDCVLKDQLKAQSEMIRDRKLHHDFDQEKLSIIEEQTKNKGEILHGKEL